MRYSDSNWRDEDDHILRATAIDWVMLLVVEEVVTTISHSCLSRDSFSMPYNAVPNSLPRLTLGPSGWDLIVESDGERAVGIQG